MNRISVMCLIHLTIFVHFIQASIFTNWKEFPGDPVYDPYPFPMFMLVDDYFPNVIFSDKKFMGHGDAVFYKMWHTSPNGIALSYSNDGIHWNLQSEVIVGPNVEKPQIVLFDPDGFGDKTCFYMMWYWTGNASPVAPMLSIQFVKSMDGVHWSAPIDATQDTAMPLNDNAAGSFFSQFFGFGTVLYNPKPKNIPGNPFSYRFVTYYDAASGGPPVPYIESIALAYSSDGIHWTRFGSEPVLQPSGNTTDWDSQFNVAASVVKLKLDGLYHMYYTGSNNIPAAGPPIPYAHGLGHASSIDGIHWKKDGDNPFFSVYQNVAWRIDRIIGPSVIIGDDYCPLMQMWFSGGDSEIAGAPANKAIGYAILPNPDKSWLKKCKKEFK